MFNDDKSKLLLKSTGDIYELVKEMKLYDDKSPETVNRIILNILRLIEQETSFIDELNKNFKEGKPHLFKQYISDNLKTLKEQSDKAHSLINTYQINTNESSYDLFKRDFDLLGQRLYVYKNLASKKKLDGEHLLDFFYLILIALIREIGILAYKFMPSDFPTEEEKAMQDFIKNFRGEGAPIPPKIDRPFLNQQIADACYKMLINLNLIDKSFTFLGKDKAAFCLLIEKLQELNVKGVNVIEYLSHTDYANLLNKKFNGLEIHPSNFTKPMTRARQKYGRQMDNFLSQLSPKIT